MALDFVHTNKYNLMHSISYKIACAPREDSDHCTYVQSDQSLQGTLRVAKDPKRIQAKTLI